MLIDQARIHVIAGDGGKGCTSFYRDRAVRKGKANGGPGGDGGNVIFRADKNTRTLLDFKFNQYFKAGRGGHGSSNHKKGKRGEELVILIPPGTILKDSSTGLVLRDVVASGESVIVARGGEGGKGNSRDREGTDGSPGEEKDISLELKLIADVGIIGFPNAGKSTFISKVSKARSKIANYPFTTKEPILGVVETDDEAFVFADMPGLIEGAHSGRGLGDEFLRHIERTKVLLHMVDISATEGRDAFSDHEKINRELELYGRKLSRKPQIIACNKMDVSGAPEKFEKFSERIKKKVFPISAATGEGVDELLNEIFSVIRKTG